MFRMEGVKDYYVRERQIVGDRKFKFYQSKPAKITSTSLAEKLDSWDELLMNCDHTDIIYRQYCLNLVGKEHVV